jgi:hypothetical protein
MWCRLVLVILSVLAPMGVLALTESTSHAQPLQASKKYALLVGCSTYQSNANVRNLVGPGNDIRIMAELLVERFGFADANITRLAGWPDDSQKRPTLANITKAFENLIARADKDTQIVILLAGHGVQVPIPEGQDPLDPKNYEPDGLDEAFVPADAGRGGPRGWHKLLLDDQIGVWLDALRKKGAAVWILFDCCNSGSMDRGGDDLPGPKDSLRVREVNAIAAGFVSETAWRQTVDKAADRVAAAKAKGQWPEKQVLLEPSALGDVAALKGKQGSVVAFFATQSFEVEFEDYPNDEVERIPTNIHGRLTWNLVQTLRLYNGQSLTYRALGQLLAARYAAEYGTRPPTPYCEGDLNRLVLGTKELSNPLLITLKKKGKDLRVTAGALHGLTAGSILAVYPALGSGDGPLNGEPLGHVEVIKTGPMDSQVRPAAFEAKPAMAVDRLPDLGRCVVKVRDFGDLKVRVAIPVLENEAANKLLVQIKSGLSKETRDLVDFVDHTCDADWVLWIHKNRVQLRQGEGRVLPETLLNSTPVSKMQRVFLTTKLVGQPIADVVADVERDLQRVFTAHNLLRVANSVSYELTREGSPTLEFVVLTLNEDGTRTPLPDGSLLSPGQRIALDVANNSKDTPYWVVLCIVGSDYEIRVFPTVLQPEETWKLKSATISGASWGKESLIAFGGPLKAGGVPDFSFLTQDGLYPETEERARGSKEKRNTDKASTTPFGKLLACVATGKGARSLPLGAPSNPLVRSWTGISLPPPDRARRLIVPRK